MIRRMIRPAILVALLVASVASVPAALPDGRRGHGKFEFALIGDVPYSDGDIPKLDVLIRDVNRDHDVDWVLHAGDIKSGSSPCSDELLRARFEQLQQFRMPLIYTPGDNEWTDAHRVLAGQFNPIERLKFLRRLFYPVPGHTTGGRSMRVFSQAFDPAYREFVENQLWVKSRVVFATLHVVGSQNNLEPWSGIDSTDSVATPRADRLEEYERRSKANLSWLDRTFDAAHLLDAKGVFLLMQADPNIEAAAGSAARRGFDEILAAISERSAKFGKPVVLAHGDSHFFRHDQPFLAPAADGRIHRLENLMRVETFGAEDVHWVRITVDPDSANVFFVEQVIVQPNRFPR